MTVELVTASLHAFRVTPWTLATRIFLAYFMDSDSSIAERELDSLDQLSVTPERVRFLVHHSRPVRVQHIRQVTNVHCIDVLFEQPFTDMLDCCVSTVIVFPRSLVVQAWIRWLEYLFSGSPNCKRAICPEYRWNRLNSGRAWYTLVSPVLVTMASVLFAPTSMAAARLVFSCSCGRVYE